MHDFKTANQGVHIMTRSMTDYCSKAADSHSRALCDRDELFISAGLRSVLGVVVIVRLAAPLRGRKAVGVIGVSGGTRLRHGDRVTIR